MSDPHPLPKRTPVLRFAPHPAPHLPAFGPCILIRAFGLVLARGFSLEMGAGKEGVRPHPTRFGDPHPGVPPRNCAPSPAASPWSSRSCALSSSSHPPLPPTQNHQRGGEDAGIWSPPPDTGMQLLGCPPHPLSRPRHPHLVAFALAGPRAFVPFFLLLLLLLVLALLLVQRREDVAALGGRGGGVGTGHPKIFPCSLLSPNF